MLPSISILSEISVILNFLEFYFLDYHSPEYIIFRKVIMLRDFISRKKNANIGIAFPEVNHSGKCVITEQDFP